MSIYNKHNSEIKRILDEETKINEDLQNLNNSKKNTNSRVCDIQSIFLQNKLNKLHGALKDIMTGNKPDNDNNIA